MKVGIYCRVSTDMQSDKKESIPDQKRLGKDFAEKMGWDYEYYEDVQSGADPSREAFNRLRADIKNENISAVWVKNHSRLARRASTALLFVEELEDLNNEGKPIPLYILNREYGYSDPNDKMMFTIHAGFSESERMTIKERMNRGRDHKFMTGGMHLANGLYGYKQSYDPKTGKSKYTIIEEQAKIIKEIFDRVIKGESYKSISKQLNQRRVPTPYSGTRWRHDNIRKIATQKMYAGQYDYKGETNIESYLYEPIVDWFTYQQAKVATSRAIDRKKGTENKNRFNHHFLTTIFDCWYCKGHIYYAHDKRFGYEYYKMFHTKNCKRKYKHQSFHVEDGEALLMIWAYQFLADNKTRWNLYEKQQKEAEEKTKHYSADVDNLENTINKIKKKKTKLLSLDLEEDDEEVLNQIRSLSAQQKELENEVRDIKISLAKQDEELNLLLAELMKDTTEEFLKATPFKKRTMLKKWIKNGWVKDEDIILEWITGRVDKLTKFRKVFKSNIWKDIKGMLADYQYSQINYILGAIRNEEKGPDNDHFIQEAELIEEGQEFVEKLLKYDDKALKEFYWNFFQKELEV